MPNKTEGKINLLDKVKIKGTNKFGRIAQRGFTARGQRFDSAVSLSSAGMPFLAGFNEDELEKVTT